MRAQSDHVITWMRRHVSADVVYVVGIAVSLAAAWVVAVVRGQPTDAMRHLFYLPVLVAAFRFRLPGAAAVALLATLLAGPLAMVGPQVTGNSWQTWSVRGAFFLVAGGTVAILADRLRRAHDARDQQTRTETELRMVLIQTLSHELRTPVTVLRGYLDTAPDPRVDPATHQRLVTAARRALDRLHGLAAAVTTCAGADADAPAEWVDLTAMAAEVHDRLAPLDARARVTWDLDVHTASLQGSTACRFALTELVTNALKHTPVHTPVHVRLRIDDDHLVLDVHDHGPGIADRDLAAATAPFHQLDGSTTRVAGGAGLGLFATRRIIETHRGTLELANRPQDGLTATARLPLVSRVPTRDDVVVGP